MKNLFERFGVSIPETIDEVNLIGVDFGDGEVSAVLARQRDGRVGNDPLFPDSTRVGYKCPNVLFLPSDQNLPPQMGFGNFQNGRAYYNFKKCPGTNEARARYRMDDGQADEYTYEQIMQMAFRQFIRALFQYNAHAISRRKRTILVVGRPAGSRWEKREKEYADLLKDGLVIEGYEKPVDIVVVSESLAAFARETNPRIDDEKRIRRGETVLIVDCGSSTFDITLVTEERIPPKGEYSRQFGGGMIEELMLKCYGLGKNPPEKEWPERLLRLRQYSGTAPHTPETMVCPYNKLELRKKKEDYFGKNGNDGTDTGIYAVFYEPEEGSDPNREYETWFFRKSLMGQVLHRMPVRVGSVSLTAPEDSIRIFPSWYCACRNVFQGAAKQLKPCLKGKTPDKVILTGGVSVMPEVYQLARECFGREPVRAELPNYSVVEGLAYVAAVEVRKNQELKKVLSGVREIIGNCARSMENTVAKYVALKTYQMMVSTLEIWKNDESDQSLGEWQRVFEEERAKHLEIGREVGEGLEAWYVKDGVEQKINESLRERFESLFPGFEDRFSYRIDQKAVQRVFLGTEVRLHLRSWRIFGILNGWLPNRPRNAFERKLSFDKVKSRSDRILKDLTAVYLSQLNLRVKVGSQLLDALEPSLKDYVERMTPYFHMFQGENSKWEENRQ